MDTQRWLRAGDIFEQIFARPAAERPRLVDELCGGDAELRGVVASMLNAEDSAHAFEQVAAAIVQRSTTTAGNDSDAENLRIGPWRLVRRLGDGGMGVVWLAERADGQFEQRAALKLIKRGMDSEAVLARFLRERQILARLQHPRIAHLLDGGVTADGRPYFAMEYIDGLPLLHWCHEHGTRLEDRIRLFLDICSAVQFAHEQHVVHRDLKPSNVLVTPNGEVKLLDFGIAKLLADTANATITRHERPMSPAYAAPEQFRGEQITPATDIYALGAVLYQLLTEKYAYDFHGAAVPAEMQRIIEASDPVAPSRLRLSAPPVPPKRLRGDLDTIVLTALKHDPRRRYPSVAAFADDLRNYLDGKPIAARRDHVVYRGWKFVRRHRVGVAAIVAIGLIAAFAYIGGARHLLGLSAPNAALAIPDFSNLAHDKQPQAWLAPVLARMLTTELAQSGSMHTLPDDLVRSVGADLSAPGAGGYAAQDLAALRKRLNADLVMSGSYLVSGPAGDESLRVDIVLQDARNGATVANVGGARTLAELPELVAAVGADLRAKFGIVSPDETARQQTRKAQPPSTDIARHLGIALDALHMSEPARARDELLDAVATAPGYAPAYLYLAQAWKAMGYDAKALANAQQAAANSAGLPEPQRLSIAREVAVDKSDWTQAVETSKKLLALDPQDPERHFDLFSDLLNADQVDAAAAALEALRKLPASLGDARVELKAFALAERRGDIDGQLRHGDLALRLAREHDAPGLAANALFDLALARWAARDMTQAEQLIRQAIEVNKRNANPQFEADSRVMMAILREQSQPQAARDEYQEALKIYQRIGSQNGLATVHTNLIRILWSLGDRDAVEVSLRKLLEINRDIGDVRSESWTQNLLVNLKMDDAADDAAVSMAQHALETSRRVGSQIDQIIALRNLADLARLRGQLDDAQSFCKQAQELADRAASPPGSVLAGYICALVALERGRTAEARSAFEHVEQHATELGDVANSALASYQLARIDAAQGRCDGASERLLAVVGELRATDAAYQESSAQALLALCYAALDAPAKRAAALARTRELRSRITFRLDAYTADVALALLDNANGAEVVPRLRALADEADRKHWLPEEFEARLAALRALRGAGAAEATIMQKDIETAARGSGFDWAAARAAGTAAQVPP